MKFYLKHILTRTITANTRDCLVIIFRIETFREAILIFMNKKKEKISKDRFPIIPFLLHSIQGIEKHTYIWGSFLFTS